MSSLFLIFFHPRKNLVSCFSGFLNEIIRDRQCRTLYIVDMSKDEHIDIRIDKAVKVKLQKLADRNRRKLADYCRGVLERHVEDEKGKGDGVGK